MKNKKSAAFRATPKVVDPIRRSSPLIASPSRISTTYAGADASRIVQKTSQLEEFTFSLEVAYAMQVGQKCLRLVYISRPTKDAMMERSRILASAIMNNAAAGITGALVAHTDFYLQVLEGPVPAVTKAFVAIAADARHDRVRLVGASEQPGRLFPDFEMKFFPPDPEAYPIFNQFRINGEFNPFFLSQDQLEFVVHWLAFSHQSPTLMKTIARPTGTGIAVHRRM